MEDNRIKTNGFDFKIIEIDESQNISDETIKKIFERIKNSPLAQFQSKTEETQSVT